MLPIDLRNHLLSHKPLTDLIGTRLHPGWFPEKVTLPAVAFFCVSGIGHHDIDVAYPRYQFSCFSPRYLEAKQVAGEIKNALKRFKGDMGGTRVIQGVFENQYEQYEKDTNLYHIAVDFKIIHWE